MKKIVILATLVVSMAVFAFKPANLTRTSSETIQHAGNNYIMNTAVQFSSSDEAAFADLQEDAAAIQTWYEDHGATDFFIVRCYENNANKFKHGTFCGGGCCTTPQPTEPSCPAYMKTQIATIKSKVDAIMANYN